MNALVVFDSTYGNTQKIAQTIAATIKGKAIKTDECLPKMIAGADLLIVGSPVHGGLPTEPMKQFLASIPEGGLRGKNIAAFDTRFSADDHGFGLRLLMKVIDYAAARIEKTLIGKGGVCVTPATGFIVTDKQGPLKAGELKRAAAWAQTIADSLV